jgi:hypothetical protein
MAGFVVGALMGGRFIAVAIGLGAGVVIAGTSTLADWWRRDPEAEEKERQRIVLRRLSGLPDREERGE